MTNEEMMGMLATKNPCASPPAMEFDSENPVELAAGQEADLDIIGGVPPYTFEILQTSLFHIDDSYIAFPAAYSDTYVKATTHHDANHEPWLSADPTLDRHLDFTGRQWLTTYNVVTNQRWNIDLGSAKIIKQIMLENSHHSATYLTIGIKDFVLQGSNDPNSLAQTNYASDQYWTDIETGLQAAAHSAEDLDDPQLFDITNEIAYRYYSLKMANNWGSIEFLGFRHVQFHTAADKVYSFVTDDPVITIKAPAYALWTARIKCTDACSQEDNAWLYSSAGKWALEWSWVVGGSPTPCGHAEFRIIKNGIMFHGLVCNSEDYGRTGNHGVDCGGYGGGESEINIEEACEGGALCTHVKDLYIYCWPHP